MKISKRLVIAFAAITMVFAQNAVIPKPAQADAASDQAAIVTVIQSQMAAFQRDDAVDAFSYASPFIQQKFQSATSFLDMVKRGYLPLYRPRGTEFLELTMENGVPVQRVRVYAPDGTPISAYYTMQRQEDGTWRINGVQLQIDNDPAV